MRSSLCAIQWKTNFPLFSGIGLGRHWVVWSLLLIIHAAKVNIFDRQRATVEGRQQIEWSLRFLAGERQYHVTHRMMSSLFFSVTSSILMKLVYKANGMRQKGNKLGTDRAAYAACTEVGKKAARWNTFCTSYKQGQCQQLEGNCVFRLVLLTHFAFLACACSVQ